MSSRSSGSWIALLALIPSLGGCVDEKGMVDPFLPEPTTLTLSPASASLNAIGDTIRLLPLVKDQTGAVMSGAPVVWSSSEPSVASIDTAGLASALSSGITTITATAGWAAGSAVLTVSQEVFSITLSPETATLFSIGETRQLEAAACDSNGHTVAGASVEWTSTDETVATVDQGGLVRAEAFGTARIVAAAGVHQDSVLITVAKPGPISLSPVDWRMPVGEQVQFTAEFVQPVHKPVVWTVNDVPGGNVEFGVIDENGLYTAPAAIPGGGKVTVRAIQASDMTNFAEAPVAIATVDDWPRILWHGWTPRVIGLEPTDSSTYEIGFAGYPRFEIERPSGERVALVPVRSGVYGYRFSNTEVLEEYEGGDLHNFVGFVKCDICPNAGSVCSVFANVMDALIPSTPVTPLAEDVQASSHLVNIRYDHPILGRAIPADVLQVFYDHFPDDFDFVAVIDQVESFHNRFYQGIRNDTEGLGIGTLDNGETYGSPARLQGIISYPISTYFDAGDKATLHEIGHRWMAFLRNSVFDGSGAHWPVSSMAWGIMGFSLPGGQGGDFPWEVRGVGGGAYELVCTGHSFEFNDLELYLMGLLPPDSVSTHVVFQDQGMSLRCGSAGPTDPITIQEIMSVNGAREPDFENSQRDFRLATVILSAGRLLSPDEMAFFNHMAKRGEATTPLHFTSGHWKGTTKPFYLATGRRATLSTRVLY